VAAAQQNPRPTGLRDNGVNGRGKARLGGGGPGRGDHRQRVTVRLGGPDQIVQQPERLLVEPLEVIDSNDERAECPNGTVGGFEGRQDALPAQIRRPEDEPFQTGPVLGHGREAPKQVASGRQRNGLRRLEAGEVDAAPRVHCSGRLAQEAGLSAARLAGDQRRDGEVLSPRAREERAKCVQLVIPPDERRAHGASVRRELAR